MVNNLSSILVVILLTVLVQAAVSENQHYSLVPKKISCLMGKSLVSDSDYSIDIVSNKGDFFSEVANKVIKKIIKNKPYDQQGIEFDIELFDEVSKLSGYIVIKESYQQINLNKAKCEAPVGNQKGFELSCKLKNPIDNQNLFLKYLYKYSDKFGIFKLQVSKSKNSLLTKNVFACF